MTDHQDRLASDPSPLEVALSALTSFQGYVQQADSKVNTLLVVHTGGAVAVVSALGGRSGLRHPTPTVLLLAGFVVAFLVSGYHVAQALRPRLDPPTPPSRFAITGMVPDSPDGVGPEHAATDAAAQRTEAWAMVRLLSRTALAKNRHLARAVPWTAAMLALGVATALVGAW
ncbi:hypothetical protein [Kitasatospora sp. GP82]|uniref:hypothetical protein n=1 Tax=Kitasatospora sp. GP82 TaxID=3035089 RepID=UPI0024754133|nr:hypothetical protein [Kitasatospora sp. GP82]MDH6123513.1 hypothetical protein [Kitasatospora sp. GP82]